jgi:hypothetical protein
MDAPLESWEWLEVNLQEMGFSDSAGESAAKADEAIEHFSAIVVVKFCIV